MYKVLNISSLDVSFFTLKHTPCGVTVTGSDEEIDRERKKRDCWWTDEI